jgi:site-specific recombinase XerD
MVRGRRWRVSGVPRRSLDTRSSTSLPAASGTDIVASRRPRHTAATVLLILGVAERVVMQIMGWSSTAMAARYQHVTGGILSDVAKRVGGLIWDVAKDPDEGASERPQQGRCDCR